MNPLLLISWCGLLAFAPQPDPQKDLAKFQGAWAPIYVEIDGKEVKDDIKNDRLIIKGTRFTFTGPKSKMEGTLKIDPAKKPPTIDEEAIVVDNKTLKSVGIYEISENRLMVCYVVSPAPRPTEFSTSAQSGRSLVIYQRVK